ncbi:MAG TPA: 16S rRNA (cytosine(967)-C(5))-methyltransferase RsmB, partial [Burkholderiaceae bacterium]|nr:16S rRNA (cytosine(967)-C(5))-methyltransferase RsmB [Burkholderiaceae bacterium]
MDNAIDAALMEAQKAGATHPRLRAAVMDLTLTATRQLVLVEAALTELLKRSLDAHLEALLAVALGQLFAKRYPPHTLVDQTVEAAKSCPQTVRAAGLVNAIMRNALRQGVAWRHTLARASASVRYNAPDWWIAQLRSAWPKQWKAILTLAQSPAPMVLRVNTRRCTCEQALDRLRAAGIEAERIGEVALKLAQALPVERIDGFAQGWLSVQDAGAQLAARWLAPRAGECILDACAAPGGKTAHLLERADVQVDAVESDPERAKRISANLARLGLAQQARLIVADAAQPQTWARPDGYNAILLDAPCTASGIVRRHPDIPWLRRPADVAFAARAQAHLLDALWPRLKPAGRLLYVVCSIFPEEGAQQVQSFLRRHDDARAVPLPGQSADSVALTMLPTDQVSDEPGLSMDEDAPTTHDGFCYALLEKQR